MDKKELKEMPLEERAKQSLPLCGDPEEYCKEGECYYNSDYFCKYHINAVMGTLQLRCTYFNKR